MYKSVPRHPLHLLRGYKLFLEEASDNEIMRFVSKSELRTNQAISRLLASWSAFLSCRGESENWARTSRKECW